MVRIYSRSSSSTAKPTLKRLKSISKEDPLLKELLVEGGTLSELQDVPQPIIQRLSDLLETITRGSIYDRSGRVLGSDQLDPSGNPIRMYTEPSLAPVLGYVSGLRIGIAGLEKTYNQSLLGLDQAENRFNRAVHKPIVGSDLVLTIDSTLQRAAEEALQGRPGSILVMDGHTGAILAMSSLPHYDPNRVLEDGYLSELVESCDGSPECSGILLNRATQALYPPGSTWKTVTLIAALDTGQVSPQTVFDFGTPEQGANGPYYVYRSGGASCLTQITRNRSSTWKCPTLSQPTLLSPALVTRCPQSVARLCNKIRLHISGKRR